MQSDTPELDSLLSPAIEVGVDIAAPDVLEAVASQETDLDSPPSPIVGFFEQIQNGWVRGWARSLVSDSPLLAELFVDGVTVGTVSCSQFRKDLMDAGQGEGFFGFEFKLDLSVWDDQLPLRIVVTSAEGFCAEATRLLGDLAVTPFTMFSNSDSDAMSALQDAQPDVPLEPEVAAVPAAETVPAVLAVGVPDSAEAAVDGSFVDLISDGDATDVASVAAIAGGESGPAEVGSDETYAVSAKSDVGIVGYIDAASVNRVEGWLLYRDTPEDRLVVEILVDDEVIGEAIAQLLRDDLRGLGFGDGMHGFSFTIPKGTFVGRPQRISVREKRTRFALPVTPGLKVVFEEDTRIAGAADSLAGDTISGWALNYRELDRPVELAVYVGKRLVGRGRTDRYRKDIATQQGGHGFYGFRIRLNQKLYQEDIADLRVVAIVYESALRVVPAIGRSLPSKPTTSTSRSVKGYLDRSDREAISGWAVDEVHPEMPTMVDIYLNSFLIRSSVAGLTRKDLATLYPTSEGRLGFSYQFPYGHSLRGKTNVSVRIANGNEALNDSPKEASLGHPGLYLESPSVRRYREAIRREQAATVRQAYDYEPTITAVVLNRDGADFLEDLFSSVHLHNTYKKLDFLIVDHGSTDGSQAVCNRWKSKLSINFINRNRNYSYSASNNFGVAQTDAEVLFILNNDIRFCSDFLGRAVQMLTDDVGIVGFKLASPPEQVRTEQGLTRQDLVDVGISIDQIQHLGVRMTTAAGDRPFLPFEEPLTRENDSFSSRPTEVPCVTAAALLVRRDDFLEVGGFHEEYFYGFEDVDFCLTFRNIVKKKIICLNDVKLYHFRSASLQKAGEAERRAKAKNKDIISRRLGGYILNELKRERIANTSFLRDSTVRVAFLVSEASDTTPAGDYFTALEIARELSEDFLFECVFLPSAAWYDLKDFDVAIAMVDGFKPSAITSSRSDLVLVAWIRNWFVRWLDFPEIKDFDAIWVSSEKAMHAFNTRFKQNVSLVRIGTNADYFGAGTRTEAYESDYCFTGSYFGSWRDIIGYLSPDSLPYTFALFGHGWNEVGWLAPYYRGPLPYSSMRDVYASTRIVVDDANHTTLAWGSVNSRVFDALAAGALVITNSRAASDDAFDGLLPVFDSRQSLQQLLEYYLGNEEARVELVNRLRTMVLERHTYKDRAKVVAADISRLLGARRVGLSFNEGESVEGIAEILDDAAWSAGGVSHVIRGKSPMVLARGFGLDIDIRLTGMFGTSIPADVLKCRFNVLIALSQPNRLSEYQASEIAKLFDFIITPNDDLAELLRAAGAADVHSLQGQKTASDLTTFERKMAFESLFRRSAEDIFQRIIAAYELWVEKAAIVERSEGPSLQPIVQSDSSETRPLRIGYVLWDFPALSQTFVINEIRWLVQNGYDVTVYYKVLADRQATLDFEVPTYVVDNAAELSELLVQHGRTVMHSPFAVPATAHLTYPAALETGIPFTTMPAGVDISHYENMRRNRIAETTGSPLCIGVVTIGSYHHEFLVEQGVPERKILLERQAAAIPITPVTPRATRAEGVPARVISIGRFVEKKGLRYLVEAAPQLPDCEIVLYGYGPLEDELRSLAERLRAKNVVFGGALDTREELWRAYSEADVFCLPCVRAADGDLDGLPTVILEAMGAGVVVVSSRIANVPDVVVDGITGFLVEPKDVDGLAKAIHSAANLDEGRRQRILGAAQRMATGYASVEDTMSTLVRVWSGKVIDIVLVTYDTGKYKNLPDTDEIIDRIFRFTSLPFNVTVVDNGSDQSFIDFLMEKYGSLPNFKLLPLGKNHWCGPATNIGIEQGSGEYIVYLCSKEGFVLRRGWECELVKYMDANPNVGMAGHVVTLPRWRNGASYIDYPNFGKFRNPEFAANNPERPFSHVQGGVYILRRKAFEEAGGFSDTVPQDGTDVEYSYFLESKGWELGDVPNVYSATVLTRPSVTAMVDERVRVIHPLSARTVGYFDKVASASTKACNVCGWQGARFSVDDGTGESVCPNCGGRNFCRSTLRLLSLTGNLQQKPAIWLVTSDQSLLHLLRPLSKELVWDRDLSNLSQRLLRNDFDLVVIDHMSWTKNDATRFATWASEQVRAGCGLVLGCGLKNDPVAEMEHLNGSPVLYDSAVSDFDPLTITAFNVEVHP